MIFKGSAASNRDANTDLEYEEERGCGDEEEAEDECGTNTRTERYE